MNPRTDLKSLFQIKEKRNKAKSGLRLKKETRRSPEIEKRTACLIIRAPSPGWDGVISTPGGSMISAVN